MQQLSDGEAVARRAQQTADRAHEHRAVFALRRVEETNRGRARVGWQRWRRRRGGRPLGGESSEQLDVQCSAPNLARSLAVGLAAACRCLDGLTLWRL